jgi:hypothetical protein
MNSNELATQFVNQGLAGTRISRGRTKFLIDLFNREAPYQSDNFAYGNVADGRGWKLSVGRNGVGMFSLEGSTTEDYYLDKEIENAEAYALHRSRQQYNEAISAMVKIGKLSQEDYEVWAELV